MLDSCARILLALLALLGAWHDGAHLLGHGLHSHEASGCSGSHDGHDHRASGAAEHEPHAPFDDPTFALSDHIGHAHLCPLCLVPDVGLTTSIGVEWQAEYLLCAGLAESFGVEVRWELDALPRRRGPPAVA